MLSDPKLSEMIATLEVALVPLARRLVGRNGAELDDLIQEGRISIWQALSRNVTPSSDVSYKRMLQWCRHLQPQNPAPYEDMSWADA